MHRTSTCLVKETRHYSYYVIEQCILNILYETDIFTKYDFILNYCSIDYEITSRFSYLQK